MAIVAKLNLLPNEDLVNQPVLVNDVPIGYVSKVVSDDNNGDYVECVLFDRSVSVGKDERNYPYISLGYPHIFVG